MHCLMCFRHTPIIAAPPTCWQSDTLVRQSSGGTSGSMDGRRSAEASRVVEAGRSTPSPSVQAKPSRPGSAAAHPTRTQLRVSNNRHPTAWTPADIDGQRFPGQACRSPGSPHRNLVSGRRGQRFGSRRPPQRDSRLISPARSACPPVRCAVELSRTGSRRRRCAAPLARLQRRAQPWEARPARAGPPRGQLATDQPGSPGHTARHTALAIGAAPHPGLAVGPGSFTRQQ